VHRHAGNLPDPVDQLCGSGPFAAFCNTSLPDQNQRLICRACDLPGGEPSHGVLELERAGVGSYGMRGCEHQDLRVLSEPEEMHEAMGGRHWTAPYVWETNYL